MPKRHEMTACELAMRVLLDVQATAKHHPHFLMGEVTERLCEEFNASRATIFRRVREAVDMLGIAYDSDPERAKRSRDRISNGIGNDRMCGWPNGRPGVRKSAR